jgi:hypothetical protein
MRKDGMMENWNIGRMEKWNVEASAEIPPRRENVGNLQLLQVDKSRSIGIEATAFSTTKDAIPSNKRFPNDKPYGSGLASFILCPLPTALIPHLSSLISHLSSLISHLSSLISLFAMPSALCKKNILLQQKIFLTQQKEQIYENQPYL